MAPDIGTGIGNSVCQSGGVSWKQGSGDDGNNALLILSQSIVQSSMESTNGISVNCNYQVVGSFDKDYNDYLVYKILMAA